MDVVLTTGFQGVLFDFKGRDSLINKGKNLVQSGHVTSVSETQSPGLNLAVISAIVIRQTSVTLPGYKVVLEVNLDDRSVSTARFNCVGGVLRICKHICAVIFYINTFDHQSFTSNLQKWGKPSTSGKEKYGHGKRIEELFPPAKKKQKTLDLKPEAIKYDDIKHISCPLKIVLFEYSKSQAIRDCSKILDILIEKVFNSKSISCLEHILSNKQMVIEVDDNATFLNENLGTYYEKNVCVTTRECMDIYAATIKQANSHQWYTERHCRISASSKAHRIRTRRRDFEQLAQSFIANKTVYSKNLEYGKNTEKIALAQYENCFRVRVIQCGLIVHLEQPWLCCSPDGLIVDDNDRPLRVLEIKCPITCIDKLIIEATGKINVPYLESDGDCYVLKKSHMYFTQAQILMYCCGVNRCDFFVYSPQQSICVEVILDKLMLKETIPKMERFYFEYFIPQLVKDEKKL